MRSQTLEKIDTEDQIKPDSMDMPECFGEFNLKSRICSRYCALSIKCCIMHARNPKMDLMEQLLNHNHYAIKLQ